MSRKSEKESYHVPKRLFLLFGLVVLLFFVLIGRLAYMQLVNRDFYMRKMATASKKMVTTPSVRGEIFDATGKVLVGNQTKQVVSFTRSNTMTGETLKETAEHLSQLVNLSSIKMTDRQLVDYYLADTEVYREVVSQLPREQRQTSDGNLLPEAEIYNNAVASVDVSQLNYSDEEKKVAYLYSQMNAVANFATGNIATDELTPEQAALIAAGGSRMPGVFISTSWDRTKADSSLAPLLGNVSTEETGLPAEEVDDYLAKGYSLNDRVGTSYLEKSYEEQLQGKRSVKEVHLDKNGNFERLEDVSAGEKGKNLKLTIDSQFQAGVEDILRNHFSAELVKGTATYSEGAYAVALNPETGAILAMAGIKHDLDSGELTTDTLGAYTNVFVPGSVVKGATLTSGWENGVISGNQVLTDQPMNIPGMNVINSWFTQYGSRDITAVQALEYSSNTYMVQIALDLLGAPYGSGQAINSENVPSAMEKLRSSFAEYGLGTSTGVDLPNESLGYIPSDFHYGNVLTNAFGQFDNYTALQLAQYAATVANGGRRLAPHLVEGIYQSQKLGELGELVETLPVQELNRVGISEEDMGLIQQGFYNVVHGGSSLTTGTAMSQAAVSISAKTGTAETFVTTSGGDVQNAVNTNVVAYAPSSNPQIAVAVVFPHNTDLLTSVSHNITRDIINLYTNRERQE